MRDAANGLPARRAGVFALAAVLACSLSFPQLAFAVVRVDETELAQGVNAVGGGTATLVDSTLEMSGVKAVELYTDEDLAVNFNGGNEINQVSALESADVELSFAGENEVEDVIAAQNANVTINANGCNEFEEVSAFNDSHVTINVAGENDFENIEAVDNASITVRGTTCQRRDIVNLGEDETGSCLAAFAGDLTIDHVTVNLRSETAMVGSDRGNVTVDTSKIAKDDGNEYAYITAGGTMKVRESVIDIAGTVHSSGKMTIEHSDVKAAKPDAKYHDDSPYRVFSETGIELVREKNGEVKEGEYLGERVFFVDTGDGEDVDLEADGKPAYYKCSDDAVKALPRAGDGSSPLWPMAAAVASAATAGFAARRRDADE